jgi:hypothetical protein
MCVILRLGNRMVDRRKGMCDVRENREWFRYW